MIESIAIGLSVLSLGVSLYVATRLRLFQPGNTRSQVTRTLVATPEIGIRQPLSGLRFTLAISQDNVHPVFTNLLKDQIFGEDATDVSLVTQDEAQSFQRAWPEGTDILIAGNVECNGYAEIYYAADLTCHGPSGAICTLIEKPPHGDRPNNLAIELIARLKKELAKSSEQGERRQALRELGGT